jgi:hypothetical protein
LATALQHYGAIMRDTGGSNSCTFYAEPISETSPVLAQMRTDMGKIVPQLRVLLNQSPTRKNFDGTSSAAGPPPIDSTICPGTVAAKASPAGTIVPTTSITDASDNVSTIDNTKVAVNGTVDGSTANVVKLAYVVLPGMAIWHENLSNKLVLQDRSNRRMRLGWCAFCQLLLVLRDWPGDSGTRTDRAWAAWRHRKAISCHHILTHWNRGRKMRGWLRHGPTAR